MESISGRPVFAPSAARLSRCQLPVAFWQRVLGAHLHVGAAFWPRWAKDIHRAESEWCKLVAERTELKAGHRVLEIGAHPGSLARWAEIEVPGLEVTLLALEPNGRELLENAVADLGPAKAKLAESSLVDFSPSGTFDRIIAVEALTQASNPVPLFDRMLSWLAPSGRLFAQIACHWRASYRFGPGDEHRWMLPDTPEGALFPGEEFLGELENKLPLVSRWELSGEHYERTARAWSNRLRTRSSELLSILVAADQPRPRQALRAWRNALLAQEVMYGFREGQEWCVTQLLLAR